MPLNTIFCKHYQGAADHKTCEAGVEYQKFRAYGLPISKWPCFCEQNQQPPGGCDLADFPTAEEIAAEEKEIEARCAALGMARKAIVEYLGGPWKRGTPGARGTIDCPVCGAEKSLCFSRAGYNGHIHAACRTKGCVSWME